MEEVEAVPRIKWLAKILSLSVPEVDEAARNNEELEEHSRRFGTSSVGSGFYEEPIVGEGGAV